MGGYTACKLNGLAVERIRVMAQNSLGQLQEFSPALQKIVRGVFLHSRSGQELNAILRNNPHSSGERLEQLLLQVA